MLGINEKTNTATSLMEFVNNKKEEEKQSTHWSLATFPGKSVHSN
jgi:hypothetical protein